ncbi:MAG: dihydrofolate reductase family protein, partial [Methanolinea sp.]
PDAPTVIAVSERAPPENVAMLEEKGVRVVRAGREKVDLPLLMEILHDEFGVRKLMVEGGPTLNWHMLHHRLVDEIRLIHLPFIVGGADTPSLVGGMHIEDESQMIRLELVSHTMCGTNLVTEWRVLYAKGTEGEGGGGREP